MRSSMRRAARAPIGRRAIARELDAAGLSVEWTASEEGARRTLRRHGPPDLAITDTEIAAALTHELEKVPTLVLSSPGDPACPLTAARLPLFAGALSRDETDAADVAPAARLAIKGWRVCSPAPGEIAWRAFHKSMEADEELTPRRCEILRHLARGATNRQIGRALGISERTVAKQVHAMCRRLGLASRVDLAMWARDAKGLMP